MPGAPQIGRRRRVLPQAYARVDWAHPLSQGLVAFVAPAWVSDVTLLNRVTMTGAPSTSQTDMGIGRRTWGTGDYLKVGETGTPIVANRSTFAITVVARVVTGSPATGGGIFYGERGTTGNPICKFGYGNNTNHGKLVFTYRDTAGTLINSVGVATIHDAGTVVVTLRRTSLTAFDAWINGKLDQTFSNGSMTATWSEATSENRIGIDAGDSTTGLGSGTVAAVILHGRALALPEIVSIAADPFQMLRF